MLVASAPSFRVNEDSEDRIMTAVKVFKYFLARRGFAQLAMRAIDPGWSTILLLPQKGLADICHERPLANRGTPRLSPGGQESNSDERGGLQCVAALRLTPFLVGMCAASR